MRHILEGYRWMWGALRRWRGGPIWERSLLFPALVVRDLLPVSRRAFMIGSVFVTGMVALLVLWPSVRNNQHRHVEIALYSDGELQVNGETSQIRDLEALLAGFPVRSATVGVGDDVTYGAVDKIQRVLAESGVSLARFERIAGSGSRRKVDLPRFDRGSS